MGAGNGQRGGRGREMNRHFALSETELTLSCAYLYSLPVYCFLFSSFVSFFFHLLHIINKLPVPGDCSA